MTQPSTQSKPKPIPITSVNHVGRITKRLEESRDFYRDVLGFREVKRPDFGFPGAWLYNYGIMIHLIYRDTAGDPTGEIDTRGDHLALHTEDVAGAEELLKAHGVAYRKNVVASTGLVQLFCRDPDGHHVEIGTYPATPPYV